MAFEKSKAALDKRWWYPIWRLTRPSFSARESFYALLAAAIAIDERRTPDETAELNALVRRTPVFAKTAPQALARLRAKIDPLLVPENDKIIKAIYTAIDGLPKKWRVAAYAHVADLVFADRAVRQSEQELLLLLAQKLEVGATLAEDILQQMMIKNEHLTREAAPGAAAKAPSEYASLSAKFEGVLGSMQKEEALYALLCLAVYADGRERDEELEELRALAMRTRTLARIGRPEVEKLHQKIWPQMIAKERPALFENACASLPDDLKAPAFAQAADITFADRKVVQEELAFLERLAQKLAIPPRDAENMIRILKLKNAY